MTAKKKVNTVDKKIDTEEFVEEQVNNLPVVFMLGKVEVKFTVPGNRACRQLCMQAEPALALAESMLDVSKMSKALDEKDVDTESPEFAVKCLVSGAASMKHRVVELYFDFVYDHILSEELRNEHGQMIQDEASDEQIIEAFRAIMRVMKRPLGGYIANLELT